LTTAFVLTLSIVTLLIGVLVAVRGAGTTAKVTFPDSIAVGVAKTALNPMLASGI
jgi:hypothetical protein